MTGSYSTLWPGASQTELDTPDHSVVLRALSGADLVTYNPQIQGERNLDSQPYDVQVIQGYNDMTDMYTTFRHRRFGTAIEMMEGSQVRTSVFEESRLP